MVHPQAAGIDVGNGSHYVAVRPEQDAEPVRRFECFTADLHRLADWLKGCGVQTIVIQSTGVYWIPLYDILEQRGFEVYLVNARHTDGQTALRTLRTISLLFRSGEATLSVKTAMPGARSDRSPIEALPGYPG